VLRIRRYNGAIMMRTMFGVLMMTTAMAAGCTSQEMPGPAPAAGALPPGPFTIAHRGASAYAPENTVPAFTLGADQGAEFVEIDIQFTKDGEVVVLHDLTLERTTDVETIFPDRSRPAPDDAEKKPRWWLEDFTLAEVQRLDAGSWFDPKFAGTRVPTFDETIRALDGRSGIFIELKSPERYPGIEEKMIAQLAAHGLDVPGARTTTPIAIQSFTVSSIERLASLGTKLPLHVLIGARDADALLSNDGVDRIRRFATGISPEKVTLDTHRAGWQRAAEVGLPITPWTFRATTVKGYTTVTEEMAYFIGTSGVVGVITDNPDLAPSAPGS
jgi:glycerophosphoryl diester phosphodiesterase